MTLVKVASGCSVVKDHAICTCCGRLRTVRVCAANLRISSSWVGRGCCERDVLLAGVSDVFLSRLCWSKSDRGLGTWPAGKGVLRFQVGETVHTRRLLTAVIRPSARPHLQSMSMMVMASRRATTSPIRTAPRVEVEQMRHDHPQYRFGGGVWCDGSGETRVCAGEDDDGEAVLHWCLLRRA
jgi:hypothetical protein